jgi:hypothetical protein
LKGQLPPPVVGDLERLVKERNWLAHDFFHTYSVQRLSDEGKAQEAVHRLDQLAQDFKDASTGLLALRTCATPGFDGEEKVPSAMGRLRPNVIHRMTVAELDGW